MTAFGEITLLLALTAGISLVMKLIRQPLIIGYILAGVLAGPYMLGILTDTHSIELFSTFGITILLFIVGLHLNPLVIREVGKVSLVTGLGQVLFTSLVGFLISLLIGLNVIAALYCSIALTFSSTIIILKLLSDKGDIQSLYGKIAVGFLLVQDIVASIILMAFSSFGTAANQPLPLTITLLVVKGLLLFCFLYAVSKYVLPKLITFAAGSSELLFLLSLSWGLLVAVLFQTLGLSLEIGALIAGITLSTSDYVEEIAARLRPLRDFFIILFFVLLGAEMILDFTPQILLSALALSLFVLIGNPIIMIVIMNLLGYKQRTGFMAGLTVAQISEFSLILATLGLQLGHISKEVMTIITLVGLITISISSYFIIYAERIYPPLRKILKFFQLRKKTSEKQKKIKKIDVLLFGYNRVGLQLLTFLKKQDYRVGVVDLDPATADKLPGKRAPLFHGDIENIEFLESLPLSEAKLIISTITKTETTLLLTKTVRTANPTATIILFAHTQEDAHELYQAGATYVVLPHHVGADHLTQIIESLGFEEKAYTRRKNKHVRELESILS
ncbi:MAG: cation:proton antiporter [Pseudomonadales bacterium]|nr:cation:proton antiporter [Candidatus Woesebacteria bacterium]MCB9802253.1 cation:proton antiporter [Pseudomonadales bacterium]